jgi:hypothetical protein
MRAAGRRRAGGRVALGPAFVDDSLLRRVATKQDPPSIALDAPAIIFRARLNWFRIDGKLMMKQHRQAARRHTGLELENPSLRRLHSYLL